MCWGVVLVSDLWKFMHQGNSLGRAGERGLGVRVWFGSNGKLGGV